MTYCISMDVYWLPICMALGITIACLVANTAANIANTIQRNGWDRWMSRNLR